MILLGRFAVALLALQHAGQEGAVIAVVGGVRQAAHEGIEGRCAAVGFVQLQARQHHRLRRLFRVQCQTQLQLARRLVGALRFEQQAHQGFARALVTRVQLQGLLQAGQRVRDAAILQLAQRAPVVILHALLRRDLFAAKDTFAGGGR